MFGNAEIYQHQSKTEWDMILERGKHMKWGDIFLTFPLWSPLTGLPLKLKKFLAEWIGCIKILQNQV